MYFFFFNSLSICLSRACSEPGTNVSGIVPAPVKFSVAPFLLAFPRVSILYPIISTLKESSCDTAPKHKHRLSSGAQFKKASCSKCGGEHGWVVQIWVSTAVPSQGMARGDFWPSTMFAWLSLPCVGPGSLCHPFHDHQTSEIMRSRSQCSSVLEFEHKLLDR